MKLNFFIHKALVSGLPTLNTQPQLRISTWRTMFELLITIQYALLT